MFVPPEPFLFQIFQNSLLNIKIYSCMFKSDGGRLFHVLYAAENVVQYLLCLLAFICLSYSDEWEGSSTFYSQLY